MGVSNPFSNGAPEAPSTESVKDNPPSESTQPVVGDDKAEVVDTPTEESPLSTVQRILAEYSGLESNVPTNLVEYWNAKRRL